MEIFKQQSGESRDTGKLKQDFERLQSIAVILRDMGFEVTDRLISLDFLRQATDQEHSFPIVEDGAQGIRVSTHKKRPLRVWFTNGFEDPANPRRQEVERRLKEVGL
jgi:hypothetical protein